MGLLLREPERRRGELGGMRLQLGYIRFHFSSHVLRAAPEGEHVVAVREARHGRRAGFGRGSCSGSSRVRGLPPFPDGAARGGGGGGDGRRDSTANGLPVERVAAGTAGEAWGAALFSLALRAVVRCRCFER